MSEVIIAALIAAGAKLASELLTKKPKNELQQPVVFSLHTSDPGDNLEQPSLRPTRLPDVYAPTTCWSGYRSISTLCLWTRNP